MVYCVNRAALMRIMRFMRIMRIMRFVVGAPYALPCPAVTLPVAYSSGNLSPEPNHTATQQTRGVLHDAPTARYPLLTTVNHRFVSVTPTQPANRMVHRDHQMPVGGKCKLFFLRFVLVHHQRHAADNQNQGDDKGKGELFFQKKN